MKTAHWQDALFRHLIRERKGRGALDENGAEYVIPEALRATRARAELNLMTPAERHALARSVLQGDASDEVKAKLDLAMAGKWEWLRSWLGEREGRRAA